MCYHKNWQSFRLVLAVKCYLVFRFARMLCVNKSKFKGP